jgi:hypothetical protein
MLRSRSTIGAPSLRAGLGYAVHALLVAVGLIAADVSFAQDEAAQQQPASAPGAGQVTTAPADRQPVLAKVLEVHGDVEHAPLDSNEWQPCKQGDEYPAETKIRTGVRSSIKLQIGQEEPYTAMLVEAVGLTYLSEAYKTEDTKRVRVGVGYGKIRAGVAEGGLKSDFTVDSPVATLSKRGTWNFGLAFERGTDRFEIFLLDYGLVDALSKITGERRGLKPGELVTQAMRRWLDQAQILRNVSVVDILGQSDIQIAFNRIRQDGLGVLGPGEGRAVFIDLSNVSARNEFARLARGWLAPGGVAHGVERPTQALVRPEGFFGTGRGDQLIDLLIEQNTFLVDKGFAKPGCYKVRRSALESWLKSHDRGNR